MLGTFSKSKRSGWTNSRNRTCLQNKKQTLEGKNGIVIRVSEKGRWEESEQLGGGFKREKREVSVKVFRRR